MRGRAICLPTRRAVRGYLLLALLCLPGFSLAVPARGPEPEQGLSWEAAQSAARKLRQVQESDEQGHSFGAVRIAEAEANSYLYFHLASYFPPGVSKVRLKLQPERPQGSLEVDFDSMKETFGSPANPLVDYLLRGVHLLEVEGTLSSSGGVAQFHLETIKLDGITLPRVVVDFLIERYLKVPYPAAAIDRPFRLPFSIDEVKVEEGNIVLVGQPPDPL